MIGYVTLTVPVKRRHELVSDTMRVYSGLFNINGDFLVNESNAYEVLGASYDGVSQTPQRGAEFTENLINEHQSNWLIGDQVRVTVLLDDAGRVHEVGYYNQLGKLALSEQFRPNGQLVRRQYWNHAGQISLTEFFDGQQQVTVMAMQTETEAHWYQWPNQLQERRLTGELDLLFDLLQGAVNRHEIDSLWVDESVAGVNWEVLGVPVRRLTDDEEL